MPRNETIIFLPILAAVYSLAAFIAFRDGSASFAVILVSVMLGFILIALSIIDLKTLRLPDIVTLPLIGTGLGIVAVTGWGDAVIHGVGAIAGFLVLSIIAFVYRLVRGRDGIGLGDAKLLAASGAWLGPVSLPSVLLWACGSALISVLVLGLVGKQVQATQRIPFGPFLAIGFWLVWLYGPLT